MDLLVWFVYLYLAVALTIMVPLAMECGSWRRPFHLLLAGLVWPLFLWYIYKKGEGK